MIPAAQGAAQPWRWTAKAPASLCPYRWRTSRCCARCQTRSALISKPAAPIGASHRAGCWRRASAPARFISSSPGGCAWFIELGGADEITVAAVAAGETIGEISAVDGGAVSASIVVDEDCTIAELPKDEFQALLARRGEVALGLLTRWAGIIRDLDNKVRFTASAGPMQRLCSELIQLARVDKPGGKTWLVPEMPSHQELAVRVQMTREEVAAAIADLASRGIVARRTRALRILDYKALKDMVRQGAPLPLQAAAPGEG